MIKLVYIKNYITVNGLIFIISYLIKYFYEWSYDNFFMKCFTTFILF